MSTDAPGPTRQQEAARWFAAERAGMMLVEQRQEFDAWRADPRNQAALDAMRDLWDDLAVLKDSRPTEPKPLPAPRRVAAVMSVLVAFCALGAGWIVLSGSPTIRTDVGQQQARSLPDGSLISVNVASNVSYAITSDRRDVTIGEGEAAFSVKPDPVRPFVVKAGDFEVRAVGTEFNVRQRDGMVEVAVREGQVDICRAGSSSVLATLGAGELLRFPAAFEGDQFERTPTPIPAAQVAEWRMRVVTYEDALVRDVVADLNRYFEPKLKVQDDALQNRRVTVRLKVDERDSAVQTLASLLDAKVAKPETGGLLVP